MRGRGEIRRLPDYSAPPERAAHVFVHGFAKNDKANVTAQELKALKRLADVLLALSAAEISKAEAAGELIEMVEKDGDEES
jgi:hypothetical protein